MNLMSITVPVLVVLGIIVVGKFVIELIIAKPVPKADLSVFERKSYLFDAVSELNLYKLLVELFGDTYYIFPQINYAHLIQPRKSSWTEERKARSRIDRKSADFVLCDKDRGVPQLIIELDGSVHETKKKHTRDEFIDELAKIVDLPVLHLKTGDIQREFVRDEVQRMLSSS